MITLTHKELQELINLEVSKALTESNNLLSSCYDMLTKMETKIENLELEIQEKDNIIKEHFVKITLKNWELNNGYFLYFRFTYWACTMCC